MKRFLHGFIGSFCFTIIFIAVFAAMLFCEQNSLMADSTTESKLLALTIEDPLVVQFTLLGDDYSLDFTETARVEQLRRKYYYLLPNSVKLMEQAVWYSVDELNTLAGG